ncbi:hypothetical protein BDB01DRAFT_798414 [Pilobolus umbonatus]|nr:hypothetical protein BDB01DRAFT_798414 [Pilobolus umbonatus]
MIAASSNRKIRPRLRVVPARYSQSTPTTHLYQQHEDDPPYSPTASTTSYMSSFSWIAEKSASELGVLLKNAYKSLKDKEKNLLLAAEIGKSLLEHNQTLKSDYDTLLQNVRQCQLEVAEADETREYFKQINEEKKREGEDEDNNMRLISSKKAHDEIIQSLERKNAELQQMLDNTVKQNELSLQTHDKKQRKLEAEIDILRQSLDTAAQKVQELEESCNVQQERAKRLDEKREFEQRETDDLALMEELAEKMEEMFNENKHLEQSKKTLEDKLVASLKDLELLRKDFENFELTNQGYANLQEAFTRQTTHIRELNDSLEDHRNVLSGLRDKGLYTSATPSLSGHQSISSISKKSLMGELENAWNKNFLTRSKSPSFPTISSKLSDGMNNFTSFYNAPADYALDTILSGVGIEDRTILDQAEKMLISRVYEDEDLYDPKQPMFAEHNIYPPCERVLFHSKMGKSEIKKGLVHRILFHIRYLFRSLLRWCRFAIILVTAILINLWKGPNLIMDR